MTHISDVHNYSDESCDAKVEELIPDRNRKAIRDEIAELVELEFDRLESDASYFLTQVAARRAEAFLEKVLHGDKDAAKQLFGGDSDRYRSKGEPWAFAICGRVFETNGIRLRREIVEANADLLRDERIKDLESIVKGLTKQIRNQDAEIERLRDEWFSGE